MSRTELRSPYRYESHFMSPTHTVERPGELLAFLFVCHPEVKKTKVRQWLKYGSVQVNGRVVTRAKHPLRAGDSVAIRRKEDAMAERELPPGMRILFEDELFIVIEKPENLLSMASATERRETAYAHLTAYVRAKTQGRGRVWIVHRLDREASGLMVYAKTEAAKHALQANWLEVVKRYLAVVEGAPPADSGVLSSHLDEREPFRVVSARPSERTRHAVTRYRVLKKTATRARVELTLETGRRNQIRVHLADAGCPIVGDRKYGAATNPAKRLALHASFLQFAHPTSGELLKFESPLPPDVARLV